MHIVANNEFTSATIIHYENTIDSTSARPGFVLLNSAWHPWWRATVDGRPADVLKANVLFRAVQVPAGKHKVHFEFEPITGALTDIARPARSGFGGGRKAKSRAPRI